MERDLSGDEEEEEEEEEDVQFIRKQLPGALQMNFMHHDPNKEEPKVNKDTIIGDLKHAMLVHQKDTEKYTRMLKMVEDIWRNRDEAEDKAYDQLELIEELAADIDVEMPPRGKEHSPALATKIHDLAEALKLVYDYNMARVIARGQYQMEDGIPHATGVVVGASVEGLFDGVPLLGDTGNIYGMVPVQKF